MKIKGQLLTDNGTKAPLHVKEVVRSDRDLCYPLYKIKHDEFVTHGESFLIVQWLDFEGFKIDIGSDLNEKYPGLPTSGVGENTVRLYLPSNTSRDSLNKIMDGTIYDSFLWDVYAIFKLRLELQVGYREAGFWELCSLAMIKQGEILNTIQKKILTAIDCVKISYLHEYLEEATPGEIEQIKKQGESYFDKLESEIVRYEDFKKELQAYFDTVKE